MLWNRITRMQRWNEQVVFLYGNASLMHLIPRSLACTVLRSQTLTEPDSHTKSGRESGLSHIELLLIGQGISVVDN